jgi:hypothetical protein
MADEAREVTTCATCGVADTHAMHTHYVAFNHPITGEPQDLSVTKHIQCCAADGCEICSVVMEHARTALPDTAPSDAFTDFMVNPPDEMHRDLFEKQGIESANYAIPATDTSEVSA